MTPASPTTFSVARGPYHVLMATTKEKPKPPAPPKLASGDDVKQALSQRRDAQGIGSLGLDDDEQGEGTSVEQIRSHLEDAHQSLSAAYDLLDQIDQG